MVIHILRDGSQVKDISGHVVKADDVPNVYNLILNINQRATRGGER